MSYPAITLKKKRERSLILRHPWLFSGGVHKKEDPNEGDIVEIRTYEGKLLGYGHYSERSQISARIFEFTQEECVIDNDYWMSKFRKAWAMRQSLLVNEQTTGYRFLHAEGDNIPGIIADVYGGELACVQLRTKGVEALTPLLVDFLHGECKFAHVYDKSGKKEKSGKWLAGEIDVCTFSENGYQFEANPVEGQKTGFYLDQRDNRASVGHFAKDRTVLNVFSYTGGFSVYALGGGAKSVVSVDISQKAIDGCERNIELNQLGGGDRHSSLKADCFDYLKKMDQDAFDMIILDPPAFTKSIKTVQKAARGYKEINLKAFRKIAKGGLLFTYSCSQHISRDLFRKIVFGAAADARRDIRILGQFTQGLDHPVNIYHPEGEYLKGLLLHVR